MREALGQRERLEPLAHLVDDVDLVLVSRGTRAPLLASCSVSPSASSMRSASRTGSRLAPRRSATSSWRIHSPGAISPVRIASRR